MGRCPQETDREDMKRSTSLFLVPVALCAIGLFGLVFTGCEKKPEAPQEPPSSPASYMNDPEFRGKLAAERKEHVKLVREGNAIAEKMKAKINALREKLKTDDESVLKAELEKDPEWNELYVQRTNAVAKVEAHRKAKLGIVRERLAPQKKISK